MIFLLIFIKKKKLKEKPEEEQPFMPPETPSAITLPSVTQVIPPIPREVIRVITPLAKAPKVVQTIIKQAWNPSKVIEPSEQVLPEGDEELEE